MKASAVRKYTPSMRFWIMLAAINVLALIYPIDLLHRAQSSDEKLFSALVLMVVPFLLMLADAISIVIAEVIGDTRC